MLGSCEENEAYAYNGDPKAVCYSQYAYTLSPGLNEEEIDVFGWFANKDLIGKYQWDDPAGIN